MLGREVKIIAFGIMLVVGIIYFTLLRRDPLDQTQLTVNQRPISERQIRSKMNALSQNGHTATRNDAVQELIDENLLAYEAQRLNQSPNDLMNFLSWVDKLKIPSEFRRYYEKQSPQHTYTDLELRNLWKERARRAYLDQLKSQSQIVEKSFLLRGSK